MPFAHVYDTLLASELQNWVERDLSSRVQLRATIAKRRELLSAKTTKRSPENLFFSYFGIFIVQLKFFLPSMF